MTELRTLRLMGTRTFARNLEALVPLQSLRHLELSMHPCRWLSLEHIGALASLETLSLYGTSGITSASGLETLTQLTMLDLHRTCLDDAAPLESLHNLQALDVSETWISDLNSLQGLTHLKSLNLSLCRARDIAPLASLTRLWHLDLEGYRVNSIEPLLALPSLDFINLSNCGLTLEQTMPLERHGRTVQWCP